MVDEMTSDVERRDEDNSHFHFLIIYMVKSQQVTYWRYEKFYAFWLTYHYRKSDTFHFNKILLFPSTWVARKTKRIAKEIKSIIEITFQQKCWNKTKEVGNYEVLFVMNWWYIEFLGIFALYWLRGISYSNTKTFISD